MALPLAQYQRNPLNFQPPNLPVPKTGAEGLASTLGPAIASLPEQFAAYKLRRQQQEMQKLELDMKMKQLQGQFGTGAPAPEGMQETPEQQIGRIGVDRYKALNPPEFVLVGPKGERVPLEKGQKPFNLPVDKPSEGEKIDERTAAKIRAEKPKALGSFQNTLREYDNMIQAAEAIRDDQSLPESTGLIAGRLNVSEGQRRIDANLDTLKAKTLLNVLSSMKELSKTGASGFGQLSEIEGENIRNSISSLKRSQGTKDFKASLERFINEMQEKKSTLRNTFIQTYGEDPVSGGQEGSQPGLPEVGGMFQGAKVLSIKRLE